MLGLLRPHLTDAALAAKDSVEASYLGGFKDGFLLATAIFSLLFVLFRRGD